MRYQCSFEGCSLATNSHFCREHRRHCSDCGLEWSEPQLVNGKCIECVRNDHAYAHCSCAYCVEAA